MNERDETSLLNIKDEIEVLMELIDGYGLQQFLDDEKTKRSVCMTLINIGELVKPLSEELKQMYPGVRWSSIAGLRDIAAHNYGGLRMDRIWGNVTVDVPVLLEQVKGILRDEGVEEEE
ncbi:MAG: DUF86 domain-containing protein [Methanomicrobiales archaeon]|jgi:uncharacterized protein with HEPN domain|nr:DUF86 domain-containing protein [Methanomicrobiales archaeon]